MLDVLTSGLVGPATGRSVMAALKASDGPGLFDRLVAGEYSRAGLEGLTLDRRIAKLDDAFMIA